MVKPITRILRLLLITLVFGVVIIMLLMASGPKRIEWLKPMIEKALEGKNSPYRVTIADAVLDWGSLNRIGTIRLTRVEWESLDGQVFATLPELDATLSLPYLLIGNVSLRSVTINKPRLFLVRDEQGDVRLGLEESRALLTLEQFMAPMMAPHEDDADEADEKKLSDDKMVRLPFRRFSIENAYMQMKDVKSGTTLISSPFSIRVGRDYAGAYASLSMPFLLEEENSKEATKHYIDGSAQWSRTTNEATAHLQFDKMPGYLPCMFVKCDPVTEVEGEFSGKVSLGFGRNFKLKDADIVVDTVNSKLTIPEYFAAPLEIKKGFASARVTDRGKHFVLNDLNLKLRDTNFMATGNAVKHKEGWSTQINAQAGPVPMKKLYKYWPITMAPDSREWVTTQITDGLARKATLAVTLQPQDFKQENFPDHFLVSEIDAENLTVNYLPGFPVVTGANGFVRFTGETMDAKVTSGTAMTGTAVAGSRVYIPNLNAPGTPMETDLTVAGPARDVATLLKLEHFAFDDALELNPETIQGDVQGHVKLNFDAFSGNPSGEINLDKVTYDIDGILKGIRQPKLWGKLDVQALDGTLKTTNKIFEFAGTSTVDDTALKLSAKQDSGGAMKVNLSGTLGQKELASVGLPDMPEVKSGKAAIDAELEVGAESTLINRADVDLTGLELNVPQLSWKKASGVKGDLSVRQTDKPNTYKINVKADDLSADGEFATTSKSELAYLSIPKLKTAKNDFSLRYEEKNEVDYVTLKGKRVNAAGSYEKEENSLLADFPAIVLDVDVGEFVLAEAAPIRNLRGNLTCDKIRCTSAQFLGATGNSDFTATIGPVNGGRRFELKAGDAGEFLKALDITDRLFNGTLTMAGDYDDSQNPAPLNARLIINKFNLKNSEILGKLLSIGSLTGIANTLTGQGIYFDKLAATLISKKGKISIKDGKASGSSIGITIDGSLDTSTTNMKMKGVIIPANWLNSFVGKIPVIGMLAGGDEGLVAFRYGIDGKYSDPQVSVNPLSGLTPGFLRNIFNVFDQAPPDELKDVEPEAFPSEPESLSPEERNKR